MMGLAGSITPTNSGKILIIISGDMSNTIKACGAKTQIRYGTGAAPANQAALTGTAVGGAVTMMEPNSTTGVTTPFSLSAIVTGLSTGTAYWVDVSLAIVSGTTPNAATIKNVSISIHEL